jgi:hypothetical protein
VRGTINLSLIFFHFVALTRRPKHFPRIKLDHDSVLGYAGRTIGGSDMKPALILLAATLLITTSFNAQTPDTSTPGLVCNSSPRTCLDYTLNIYLKALLVHKPEALPVTDNVKFTENGVARKLGEGLWQTITKFNVEAGGSKQEYIDLPQQTAALHMIAMEGQAPALFILKIKVAGRKIADAETHVIRSHPDVLLGSSLPMNFVPKQFQLNSREELMSISAQYLEARKSGKSDAAESIVAVDAYRMENGRTGNLRTQPIVPSPGLTWRTEAVDEVLGLVWVREDFGTRLAWEGFKIYDGQIHAIEGFSGM